MNKEQTFSKVWEELNRLTAKRARSAWGRGVSQYATDMLAELEEYVEYQLQNGEEWEPLPMGAALEKILLNGADNWSHYSWSGCSLCYNEDIARTLCTPSELKRTDYGRRRPNAREEWLDTQARALYQASLLVKSAVRVAQAGA